MKDLFERSRLARNNILARVRAGLEHDRTEAPAAAEPVQTMLDSPLAGPRPPPQADLLQAFRSAALSMSSTVDMVSDLQAVPDALARWLQSQSLPTKGVVWPELASLDWAQAGLSMENRPVNDTDLLGVTSCFCAIAETGTLLTASSRSTPAAVSLLPETHVAVLPASRIVAGMEECWSRVRQNWPEGLPRALNFISGPSRTGDIELTIVLGAHGPYRVHVVILTDA